MPITIIGVINGKKYAVLKNPEPLILRLRIEARISGIITPKIEVASAKITVFNKIFPNSGSVKISL